MGRKILYWFANVIAIFTCALAKLGVGKTQCDEYRASRISGLSIQAYESGDFKKCYELLAPYLDAEDDYRNGSIKYRLAMLFFHGNGVALNRPIANRLIGEAAELGNEKAQKYLSQFDGPYKTRTSQVVPADTEHSAACCECLRHCFAAIRSVFGAAELGVRRKILELINNKPINKEIKCNLDNCGCRYNTFMWYSHKLDAVYYETPKAACSSIKKALDISIKNENILRAYLYHTARKEYPKLTTNLREKYCLQSILNEQKDRLRNRHPVGITTGKYEFSMYYGSFEESIKEFENYYKFGLVRDPINRTISNFRMFFDKRNKFRFGQVSKLYGKKLEQFHLTILLEV